DVYKRQDVISHIGDLTIIIKFKFDNIEYKFVRTTNELNEVKYNDEVITKKEFTSFLAKMYNFNDDNGSFRDSVNGFSRIYQKKNYNENRPLDTFLNENGLTVKKRSIKLFGYYKIIKEFEEIKSKLQDEKKNITATFKSGVVNSITLKQYKDNKKELGQLTLDIDRIKLSISNYIDNFEDLINDTTINLKENKDYLYLEKISTETDLNIVNNNLNNEGYQGSKYFKNVVRFFPTIDESKLLEIDDYHKGLTTILNEQFKNEKDLLEKKLNMINQDIEIVKIKLQTYTRDKNISESILNELLDKDKKLQKFDLECKLYDKIKSIKDDIKTCDKDIMSTIESSLLIMEEKINNGLKSNIEAMYGEGAIVPELYFTKKGYTFSHGDDRGTGKCCANMIALDLTYLSETKLPFIIHDSLLLKNMKSEAVTNLIHEYLNFDNKQIFIAIDELNKYKKDIDILLRKHSFLTLEKDNFAFKISWKKK
ncbi:DUF2326 domain-containing protein, partial [Photobacterium phosphoreum]|uniref:DUF2326 domain-containing protein n=1 Tax=Photobacterium phosphoreum TaxID=659 RepID=UPI0015E741BA